MCNGCAGKTDDQLIVGADASRVLLQLIRRKYQRMYSHYIQTSDRLSRRTSTPALVRCWSTQILTATEEGGKREGGERMQETKTETKNNDEN